MSGHHHGVRALAAAAILVAALWRPALAEPPVAIRMEAPVAGIGCDLATVRARVVRLLDGRDPFDADAPLVLWVASERADGQALARLVVVDEAGREHGARILVAASCAELRPSLALVIALAVRSGGAGFVGDRAIAAVAPTMPAILPEGPPPAPPPAAPQPAPDAARPLAPAPAPLPPRRPTTRAVVAGAAGAPSDHGWQARLVGGVRLRRGWWSLEGEVELHAPDEVVVGEGAQRIRIATAAASLLGCGHLGAAILCGMASGGGIRGSGVALLEARAATTPLAALGARLGWEQGLTPRLALRLHLDGRALLTTTRFLVDDRSVWISPRYEAWLGAELIATFP